ncbi:PBS lyase HEAT-like repeat domain protein [Paenibacillus sp. JCM 10914]|nr:PBS lyase HEAT-like repeat domain protein [Paenibacillus sp. JCM 10914]
MEERRKLSDEEIASAMKQEDWRVRYAALDVLEPTEEHTPLLRQALEDPKMQIRRLAVVYLGDLRTSEAWSSYIRPCRTMLRPYAGRLGIHCPILGMPPRRQSWWSP